MSVAIVFLHTRGSNGPGNGWALALESPIWPLAGGRKFTGCSTLENLLLPAQPRPQYSSTDIIVVPKMLVSGFDDLLLRLLSVDQS